MTLKNVMIIDDSSEDRYIISRLLKKTNLANQALEMSSGQEALTYLESAITQNPTAQPMPDIIFLDINMPIISGFDFLEKFHTLWEKNNCDKHTEKLAGIQFYMLTSSINKSDKLRAESLRVKGFIGKPPALTELATIMQTSTPDAQHS